MLPWIGLALMSVAWLFGLGYYHPDRTPIELPGWLAPRFEATELHPTVEGTAWTALILIGAALMTALPARLPPRRQALLALVLTLPAVALAPRPYRDALLLIAGGLVVYCANPLALWETVRTRQKAPERKWLSRCARWGDRLGAGAVVAGALLTVQALSMLAYETATARSHELPPPLPHVLGRVAQWLGIETGVYENTIPMFSMRKVHLLGATWELLLDPPTFCFLVGAAVLIVGQRWSAPTDGKRARAVLGGLGTLVALAVVWLPVRAGLMMAVYLNDVLRTEYDSPLTAVKLFWNPWLHLALLNGPVLLAWRFLPLADARRRASCQLAQAQETQSTLPDTPAVPGRLAACPSTYRWGLLAVVLVLAAAAAWTAALFWDPVGERQPGRVVFEEYHPPGDKDWEPTRRPFDTNWYGHLSGYNYYSMYDYLSRFYETSRTEAPLSADALADCDVLVVKVPTRRFAMEEIYAIHDFVRRGGGLLLIGEHTDVFGVGRNLNAIAREFGFSFRYDCLFGIDKVFEQRYELPLAPHPVIQNMGPLDFATSCSIDPGWSWGRAVIRSAGLKNLLADYHADNYYPQPVDRAEMRYGAFVQLWSKRYGQGRVLAFTDSTIFSNFCTFEPGKIELLTGMVEWLNHRSALPDPLLWLGVLGLVLLGGGVWAARRGGASWLVLGAAALAGWAAAVVGIRAGQAHAMPLPEPQRPLTRVVLDRTVCSTPLPKNGFVAGKSNEFGIFERWILRLGYFTARRSGSKVFDSDSNVVVFLQPDQPIPAGFQEELSQYVSGGGKVLVLAYPVEGKKPAEPQQALDQQAEEMPGKGSPGNAAELVAPFGLEIGPTIVRGPTLTAAGGWAEIPAASAAFSVSGGEPFAWLGGQPVGASVKFGQGTVTVVGFGARFTDSNMGVTGDVVPSEGLRKVFDWEYSLLRAIVEDKPLGEGTGRQAKPGL